MIDKIPTFDDKKLAAIEENANRLMRVGSEAQKAHAEGVLLAISAERRRRLDATVIQRKEKATEIAEKVSDKELVDRVLLAFTAMPPQQWEVDVLRGIAANPGSDGTTIARAIGKRDVGYINLAVGSLCSTRQRFLGVAPPPKRRNGKGTYSDLLIDFTLNVGPSGSGRLGWTLKPEAHAALKRLGIVA